MAQEEFLTEAQERRIISAIKEAENKTSGEIRVHIEHNCSGDALERAADLFHDLGMDQTDLQNGVLVYIASEDHKAAVYAGKGIHKQVEDGFWDDVLQLLLNHFRQHAFEQGLVEAVKKVGHKLTELFPYQRDDANELSNEISYHDNQES